jgi:hypothetical protein
MLDILTEEQINNRKREFFLAKKISSDDNLYAFLVHIYENIRLKVKEIEASRDSNPVSNSQEAMKQELGSRLIPQRLFAHTDTSFRHYKEMHGSVGERSVLFFEQLPEKSSAYFDILFVCISNAIYQYCPKGQCDEGRGLISDYSLNLTIPAAITETRRYRQKILSASSRVRDFVLMPEERAVYQSEEDSYTSQGEKLYQLHECELTTYAKRLGAPVFTGLSGDAYVIFKFLTTYLKLNQADFLQLRKALVAYLVALHDHSVIEVLLSINMVLVDPEFASLFDFDVRSFLIKLDDSMDYQCAIATIFEDVLSPSHISIRNQCDKFLSHDETPRWLGSIIEHSIDEWLKTIETAGLYGDLKDQLLLELAQAALRWRQHPTWDHLDDFKLINRRVFHATRKEILAFLDAIRQSNDELLRGVLSEEQDERSITTLQSVVELYCHSKFSKQPLKIVGNGFVIRGAVGCHTGRREARSNAELIKNFGLCSIKAGSVLEYPLLLSRGGFADVPQWGRSLDVCNGAILSTKGYTPLLNFAWILAAALAKQEVFLVRMANTTVFSAVELYGFFPAIGPLKLCMEVYVLSTFGYKMTSISGQGLCFTPPKEFPEIKLLDILSGISVFHGMKESDLVIFMNQLFDKTDEKQPELKPDCFG